MVEVVKYTLRTALEAAQGLIDKPLIEGGGDEYDPASDDRWNAGVDFAMMQLCKTLKVDPKSVNWDAATDTLDGDVGSVIGNVLEKAMGDNWQDALSPALVKEGVVDDEALIERVARGIWDNENCAPWDEYSVSKKKPYIEAARAAIAALPVPVSVQEQKT